MRRRTREALKTTNEKKGKNDLTSHPVEACIHSPFLKLLGYAPAAHTCHRYQRRLILPVAHLQSDAVRAIDDGFHDTVNSPARRQANGGAVAGLILAIWLLAGHGGNVRLLGTYCLLNAKPLAP